MNKVGIVERDGKTVGYLVKSPATGTIVDFEVGRWTFNGNMDAPTFAPSMVVPGDQSTPYEHFFVRSGKIEYLQDCAHTMAGMTVDMVGLDGEEAAL